MSTDISVSAKPRKLTPMKKTKPKGNDIFFKMPLCMKNNGNPVSWACNIFLTLIHVPVAIYQQLIKKIHTDVSFYIVTEITQVNAWGREFFFIRNWLNFCQQSH